MLMVVQEQDSADITEIHKIAEFWLFQCHCLNCITLLNMTEFLITQTALTKQLASTDLKKIISSNTVLSSRIILQVITSIQCIFFNTGLFFMQFLIVIIS